MNNLGLPIKPADIPDKTYFKIGEVCDLTGLKSHTLRYWEAEFTVIKPQRAGSKQRLYRRKDVENILRIKKLVHEDGLTLSGTRKLFAKEKNKKFQITPEASQSARDLIEVLKKELSAIKNLID